MEGKSEKNETRNIPIMFPIDTIKKKTIGLYHLENCLKNTSIHGISRFTPKYPKRIASVNSMSPSASRGVPGNIKAAEIIA